MKKLIFAEEIFANSVFQKKIRGRNFRELPLYLIFREKKFSRIWVKFAKISSAKISSAKISSRENFSQ